jgi:uncharacterized membrane protein
MKNFKLVGLVVSTLFMVMVVPYTLIEWFDNTIPFSMPLLIISAMSVFLLAINLRNYRKGFK